MGKLVRLHCGWKISPNSPLDVLKDSSNCWVSPNKVFVVGMAL